MHVINHGHVAAALILAGVSLPAEFNVDEAVIARKDEELRGKHPKLDKVAIDTLAIVAAGKDLAEELRIKKEELEKAVPEGSPEVVRIYKEAHTQKRSKLHLEVLAAKHAGVRKQAEDDAEAAFLAENGLIRDADGNLVAAPLQGEAESDADPDANPEKPANSEPANEKEPAATPDSGPGTEGNGTIN